MAASSGRVSPATVSPQPHGCRWWPGAGGHPRASLGTPLGCCPWEMHPIAYVPPRARSRRVLGQIRRRGAHPTAPCLVSSISI